jgi:hypothetical protein
VSAIRRGRPRRYPCSLELLLQVLGVRAVDGKTQRWSPFGLLNPRGHGVGHELWFLHRARQLAPVVVVGARYELPRGRDG